MPPVPASLSRRNRLASGSHARTLSRRTAYSWTEEPGWKLAFVALGIIILMVIGAVIYQDRRPNFTISADDDLQRHLSYRDSIMVAQKADLPIYKKPLHGQPTRISVSEAYGLEHQTAANLVNIPVYPNDRFDLRWGVHFIPAPGKPAPTDRHL